MQDTRRVPYLGKAMLQALAHVTFYDNVFNGALSVVDGVTGHRPGLIKNFNAKI